MRQALRLTPADNFSVPQKMSDTSAPIAAAAPLRQVSSPLVYVIVLNWNSPQMTADCVRSLLAMAGTGFRVVVVDNGSRNDSAEFLQRTFSEISVIANGSNLGFAGGCNVGMRRALEEGADYVLLVNNDTIVDRYLLRELISQAEAEPRVGILSPKIYYADPADLLWWAGGTFNIWIGLADHIARRRKDVGDHNHGRDLDWATGCVMLLRCEALSKAGLFDEQIFAIGEDVDLSLRMKKAGYTVRYVPTARLWHREGAETRKSAGQHVRIFLMVRNLLWVMHKHARAYHWVTFLPFFLFYYLPKMMILNLSRGDFRSCGAMLEGVVAFCRMIWSPGASVLPPELSGAAIPRTPERIAADDVT
jgi:GT2 family glycosyltransferase